MSSITDTLLDPPAESTDTPLLLRRLSSPVSAAAFWVAVAMPMAYVPVLLTGIRNAGDLGLFVGLLLLHLVALRAGRSHRSE